MPLTRVSLLKGKPPKYRKAILDGLYQAMRESFGVPEDDRFMLIEEYDKSNFDYGKNYLGIGRDDDLVIIQITVNNTRGVEQKKALFCAHRGAIGQEPRDQTGEYFDESFGSSEGKLVFWQRGCAICVSRSDSFR
jgi:4-oxalocrotonate tautomerase